MIFHRVNEPSAHSRGERLFVSMPNPTPNVKVFWETDLWLNERGRLFHKVHELIPIPVLIWTDGILGEIDDPLE